MSLSRVLLLSLVLSSCLSFALSANSLTITTDKGQIQGYTEGGVDKWRGIPYAAPPVGNLRFAVPQDAPAWSGVLSTTSPAPICPQLYIKLFKKWSGSEDCLYANVYAPIGRNLSEPLPVFVSSKQSSPYTLLLHVHISLLASFSSSIF